MARKAGSGDGKTVSKAFAYRDAAKELGKNADLDKVQQFIRDKYGIEMKKQQISQYRSNEKKRKGRRGRRGRKEMAEAGAAPAAAARGGRGDSMIEFVSAVRGWESKLGADQICKVIDALYKKR